MLIPGTGVIYTISTGLLQGVRASVFAALGCTVGIIPLLIACILGLSAIVHTSAIAFQLIKFAGVVYLLYLAWGMWRESGTLILDDKMNKLSMLRVGIKGFLTNILNPKLSLFFLAFLPQFVSTQAEAPLINMLALSGIFMAMTLFVFILYGMLANGVSTYIVNSPNAMKYIQRTFSASFAMLGAKLVFAER